MELLDEFKIDYKAQFESTIETFLKRVFEVSGWEYDEKKKQLF